MAPSRRVAAAAAALLFLLTTLIGVSCESLISSHQQIKRNSDEYLNGDPDPGFSQRGTCQEEGVHVSGQGSQRGVQADLSTRLRSGMGGQGSPKVRQLSERGAQLAALEGNLLEQEELVLSLVRLLETQRDQISQLLSEAGSQDCSCPCRQLADWRQNRAQEKSLLITLQEPTSGSGLTKGPVNDDVASPVVVAPQGEPSEIMSASVAKSAAFGGALVGYQERLVVRPRVAWADHFKLLAAVQVGAQVTCLHAVQQELEDGLSPYVAVGDSHGALHVFQPTGQLVCEHFSTARSPVTALVSFSKGPLETWLVSGHSDGALLLHSLTESDVVGGSDDPPGAKIVSHGSLRAPGGGLRQSQNEPGASEGEAGSLVENRSLFGGSEPEGEVKILHMLRRGGSELLLAADATGGLEIFDLTEQKRLGILYKRTRILAFQKPLTSTRVVFVSKSGVGRVDLARMIMHPVECTGLDGIVLESFAFDVNARSKGYGIVEGGKEMVVVNVGGDGRGVHCQLLARRKGAFEGATALQAIKGYLLARSEHGADVFNTSLPKFGAGKAVWARPMFSVPSAEITGDFNWHPASPPSEALAIPPPFATNNDRLVVLAFPGGLVGMYRSELPLPRVRNLAASFPGTPVFIAIVLAAATWQVLLRRPARAASAFSAEGLGKWTENDLREFVKQHVSGNRTESGRNRDKPGRNPDGTRSSGSWRESPSSSREGSIDRPRTRERSVERPGGEKPGANPTPRNVAADFARTGEKENVPRVPVRQGSVRKEDPGGGPPRSVLGNLRLGASGANGQLELVRTMSLQLPPRPESPPLMRTQSLSSTPGATQRAASINTDLDAFLKEAGFGDFCEPGNVSRSNSINSDFSLETLNTTSGSGRVAQSRSAGGVSTASQPRFGSGLRTGGGEPGSISLPHFVAEDFSGKSGAPQGVLEKGENLGVRLRGGGVPKKLASALSAEAQGIEKFLMGVKMDNQHLDQPKSW